VHQKYDSQLAKVRESIFSKAKIEQEKKVVIHVFCVVEKKHESQVLVDQK
jgi:hypothetical protein